MSDNSARDADCTKIVSLRGEQVRKSEVPLGKEFTEDGLVRQTSMSSPVKFGVVGQNVRFKFCDEWCIKTSSAMAHALDPNMPFGRTSMKQVHIGETQTVRLLVVDDRGPA
ncbi:MAG TPA: hypothetical protein VMH91_03275 [Candidatus Paceibacterota bacterium]|nr:hypothetical protein [Candidatus Paceibacterota bacterium]